MAARKNPNYDLPKGHIDFRTYLSKILTQVHPDHSIGAKAMGQLNAIVYYIGKALADKAEVMTKTLGKKTITSREIQNAVRVVFPQELGKHGVSEGTKAVVRLEDGSTARGSMAKKAELRLSPKRVERFFRFSGTDPKQKFVTGSNLRLGSTATTYLAAVLEYFAGQLLNEAGDVTTAKKLKRITVSHLSTAVQENMELSTLMRDQKIRITGGGVLPFIREELKPERYANGKIKPSSSKKSTKSKSTTKGRKSRPGMAALRQVKHYQSLAGCHLFAKLPFERLIREYAQDMITDIKFSAGALRNIQLYIEAYLVGIFQKALAIAIHAGRETVSPRDIQLVRFVNGERV